MQEIFLSGFRYAVRNILRSWLRATLTVISVALAISLYAFLTAMTASYNQQMSSIIRKGDVDIIVQSKFSASPLSSSIRPGQVKKIEASPEIKSSMPVVIGKIRTQKENNIIYVFGLKNYKQIAQKLGLTLLDGKPYTVGKDEILMASKLMHILAYRIGSRFPVTNDLNMTIVGAYSSWISMLNSTLICSAENARRILRRTDKTNMMFLTLKNPTHTGRLMKEIQTNYPDLIAIKSGEFSSHIGIIKNLAYILNIVAWSALLSAVAILMNTFLVAVNERTQEIGILGAIGWPKSMILSIFTAESILLAGTGGIIGLLMASGILAYIRSVYVSLRFYLPDSLGISIWAMSMGMSLVVGVAGAMIPAMLAANKPIAKALKDVH